jgi:hypothetical protein
MIGTMWRFAIATVGAGRTRGRIGICSCPGWAPARILGHTGGGDFQHDFDTVMQWNPEIVVTLLEPFELRQRGIEQIGLMLQARGIEWLHIPISPGQVPQQSFDERWSGVSEQLKETLRAGGKVLLHSLDSCGRAALVAARLLVDLGCRPQDAVNRVMAARPGSMYTEEQRDYILSAHFGRGSGDLRSTSRVDADTDLAGASSPVQAMLPLADSVAESFNPAQHTPRPLMLDLATHRPMRESPQPRSST